MTNPPYEEWGAAARMKWGLPPRKDYEKDNEDTSDCTSGEEDPHPSSPNHIYFYSRPPSPMYIPGRRSPRRCPDSDSSEDSMDMDDIRTSEDVTSKDNRENLDEDSEDSEDSRKNYEGYSNDTSR